jgi:hypothetical protein
MAERCDRPTDGASISCSADGGWRTATERILRDWAGGNEQSTSPPIVQGISFFSGRNVPDAAESAVNISDSADQSVTTTSN